MKTSTLIGVLSALASTAFAAHELEAAMGVVAILPEVEQSEVIPAKNIFRRDIDQSCVASVSSKLSVDEPKDTGLANWAMTAVVDNNIPGCEITAPATLSDEFLSYWSVYTTWLETVGDVAEDINTKCGYDELSIVFTQICTESPTIYFTSIGEEVTSTILEPVDIPKETIYLGAAARTSSDVVGLAVFFAVGLGAIVAL